MKVGLIGAGQIAPANADGIMRSAHCDLRVVMDIDENAAASLGGRFDRPHTTELEHVLQDDQVDTVAIAVPHNLHHELVVAAAEAGKHVVVEKPMATTVAEAKSMIEVCDRNNVELSVLFSFRYEPRVQSARRLIEQGVIGEPTATSVQFITEKSSGYYAAGGGWRSRKSAAGGGVLLMNVCHMLDYLRFVTGLEVERLSAEWNTNVPSADVEDTIVVALQYGDGAVGSILATTRGRGERWQLNERIWGSHGTIELSPNPMFYSMRRRGKLRPARWRRLPKEPQQDRIATYFDDFAVAVLNSEQPPISGFDGLANVAVIEAAYESASGAGTVELELPGFSA